MNNKCDKRIIKTKLSIRQAFLKLLSENDFEKITVQMIIDEAFIGKGTFYYHYQDKYDLAEQVYKSFLDSINSSIMSQLDRIEQRQSSFAEIGNYAMAAMNEYPEEYKQLSKLKQFNLDNDLRYIIYGLFDYARERNILDTPNENLWIYAELILSYIRHIARTGQTIAYYDYMKQINSFTGQYLELLDGIQ